MFVQTFCLHCPSPTRDVGGGCGNESFQRLLDIKSTFTMAKYKSIQSFALTKMQLDSILKHHVGVEVFDSMPKYVRDRLHDTMTRIYRLGIEDGALAMFENKICDECFGTGEVTHVSPAHVEAGIAKDEQRHTRECHVCNS